MAKGPPSKRLTDTILRAYVASPPASRLEVPDGTIEGLAVRVGPRGKPAWTFRFRVLGDGGVTDRGTRLNGAKYHRVALGIYPQLSIKEARQKAAAYVADIEAGRNPLIEIEAKAVDRLDTFSVLAADFLTQAETKMRTWRTGSWCINKHLVPPWGKRPAGSITEAEAKSLIERIRKGPPDPETGVAKPSPGAAYDARKWGNMLFRWAVDEGRVKANPFASVKVPELAQRRRHLKMDEARAVWAAAADFREPWGAAIQLLLLTGCREMEICGARREWLEESGTEILIPGAFFKSGREFLVCLSPAAAEIVGALPHHDAGDYLLSTTAGKKPIAGVPSKIVRQIHTRAEEILGRPMERWALHDLRRTVRTHLPRLKVDEVVAEVVLGHALKGLPATYNLYGYREEKRQALELWADDLLGAKNEAAPATHLDAEAIAAALKDGRLSDELAEALATALAQ